MVTDSPDSNAAPPGARSVLSLEQEAIRSQLAQILASPEFRSSQRCQEFLRFVVEQSLAGHANVLKERTIGVEAFGRAADYETNLDGVVRIKASEVRKRLSLYYAGSGKAAKVVIELPVGSYVPNFTARESSSQRQRGGKARKERPQPRRNQIKDDGGAEHRPRRSLIGIALIVIAAAAAISLSAYWWHSHHAPSVLNEFWEPILRGPGPVLIAAAYVPVYAHDARMPNDQGELIAHARPVCWRGRFGGSRPRCRNARPDGSCVRGKGRQRDFVSGSAQLADRVDRIFQHAMEGCDAGFPILCG